MILEDKYILSREENVFVAKKYLKDSVYRSAYLEGMAVTFPQTEAILENAIVNDVPARDVSKVIDLKRAWEFLLENLDTPLDLKFLEELHEIIANDDVPWDRLGKLRTERVRISGTNYLPDIPQAEVVHRTIDEILGEGSSDTNKAIDLLLYLMRSQLFLDGNKRIATFACNKILISTGHGLFSLPPELRTEFVEGLIQYYESGQPDNLKQFIFDNCLTGL